MILIYDEPTPNKLATLLAGAFRTAHTRGDLFGGMQQAIMSLIYKQNGKDLDRIENGQLPPHHGMLGPLQNTLSNNDHCHVQRDPPRH